MRLSFAITALILAILFTGSALAQTPTPYAPASTQTQTGIYVTSAGGTETNQDWMANLSSQGMIDAGYLSSTGLDAHLIEGGVDAPVMPGSGQMLVEQFWTYDATTTGFTDKTAAANSGVANSVVLIDGTPEAGDQILIGSYHLPRILWFDITTRSVGTALQITWQYCDGSGSGGCNPTVANDWTTFSNQVNTGNVGNVQFTVLGEQTLSYTLGVSQNDWTRRAGTMAGTPTSYWLRGNITAATLTTNPLLGRVSAETGRWWGFAGGIAPGTPKSYTLYTQGATGSAADKTYHQYFSGPAGIVTADNAGLEPGTNYEFDISGYWDTDTVGTNRCAVSKAAAVTLCVQSAGNMRYTDVGSAINLDFALSSGEHRLQITNSATGAAVSVDGAQVATAADMAISNTANAWNWAADGTTGAVRGSLPYTNWIRLNIGGTLELEYQLDELPGPVFLDTSGNGFNATSWAFPTLTSLVNVAIAPTGPVSELPTGNFTNNSVLPTLAPPPSGDGTSTQLPLYGFVDALSDFGNGMFPTSLIYQVGYALLTLFVVAIVFKKTRRRQITAGAATALVMFGAAMYLGNGDGIYSFWVFAIVGVFCVALMFADTRGAFN